MEKLEREFWRPIIFSRNTAQVTIPSGIRDRAKLVTIHNDSLGVYFTYNEAANEITMKVGVQKPVKKVVISKKKGK